MQKFSSDSSIINSVHSLLMISPGKGEGSDFSISNNVAVVKISNYLYILEIIPDFRSDTFNLIDLELPTNYYMIACTNTQIFEEGENCLSIILVEHLDLFHTLGSDIKLFGSYMILFFSSFKVQEPSNTCLCERDGP